MPDFRRFALLVPVTWLAAGMGAAHADGLAIPSTAIVVNAINQPHVVRASDGNDHVEYDLLVTNAFASPATLSSVDITGPGGAVLGRIEGATLAAATQGVLLQQPVTSIPPSGAASVEIDLILPLRLMAPGAMPPVLSHRITYALPNASAHLRAFIGSYVVDGPDIAVAPFRAITILSPLSGAGWASINGCCTPNAHRDVRIAAGTRIGTAETFAIDYARVEGDRFYQGDGKTLAQYPYMGAPVHAVVGGTVVSRHDGMAETVPFGEATTVQKPEDFGGNYVLIRQAEGVYAFYAHLQKGSVAAEVGQRIAAGAVIGLLGNSGNSTNPHLHFGLLDRPDFITGDSLPFVFADFSMSGRIVDGDDSGTMQIQADNRRIRNAYPLVGAIAAYP